MERNIDNRMSRLCGRLMSVAQNARDAQEYILEEMEYILEANPDREDVRACIDEIKAKNKASESVSWATANHWSEHFDNISAPADSDDDEQKADKNDAAADTENNKDNDE